MFKTLLKGAQRLATGSDARSPTDLFPKVTPAVDGDDCLHDCASCSISYPKGFKIDESDELYGHVKGWATHILVATGKSDWVRDVADEKGSVMQAIEAADKPTNGRLMLSASNIPTPHHTSDYAEPTTVLLLPAFTIVENVSPATVPHLLSAYIDKAPTNTSALTPVFSSLPRALPPPADLPSSAPPSLHTLTSRPSPHAALVLLCSQRTRDARCGQSAPLLRKELERHLRPLGLYRDLDDQRPGGVGVYFISHTGGHKYSANMMVYRRPDAFGVDDVERAHLGPGEVLMPRNKTKTTPAAHAESNGADASHNKTDDDDDVGAAQCIWLARVKPEDIEGIVKYTVLQGKVVKPESQLRGGFDRSRGVMSW
ncbi:Sucrase/ferredoxin-like-domain-containing protein [Coniella lustricola]|uniref:Sucrase/ferredoxin-like-domain-containing protein n=1 Tax=Coniella lustricola TaxID=2025994 RepID=A0A2T3A7G0_9PEZI|nr:Sucrase/ferredoxin-like-domain-containing protein [Coniella lustricola]